MGAQPQNSAGYYGSHQLNKPEWGKVGQEPRKCRSRERSRMAKGCRVHSSPTVGVRNPFSEKKPRQRKDESALFGTQTGGLALGQPAGPETINKPSFPKQ